MGYNNFFFFFFFVGPWLVCLGEKKENKWWTQTMRGTSRVAGEAHVYLGWAATLQAFFSPGMVNWIEKPAVEGAEMRRNQLFWHPS